jgi:FkbM family methyltransferase
VEPSHTLAERIRANADLIKLTNCQVADVALGGSVGNGLISETEFDTRRVLKGVKMTKYRIVRESDEIKARSSRVVVTTLDNSILAEFEIPEPILIKIDTDGSEPSIVSGAEQTLSRDCTIFSEFWPWGLERQGYDPVEYVKHMQKCGFGACNLRRVRINDDRMMRFCNQARS